MSGIRISNRITKRKKKSYEEWWDAPVECVTEAGIWETNRGEPVTHGMYVKDYYDRLKSLLIKQGYDITDEKGFKCEIARLIYTLSDDHL